jgi:hypothetical protein
MDYGLYSQWRIWFRDHGTNWAIVVSNPVKVSGISIYLVLPASHTVALMWIQSLTRMSTTILSGAKGRQRQRRKADSLIVICETII